ncbi:MAG: 30S ribosomal protein S2 [Patescibacteria group bacterium]
MEKKMEKTENNAIIEQMFKSGAHYGYSKSRRHPSAKKYIFGVKNRVEIFDLEKTEKALESAKEFVKSIIENGKQIIFVSGKNEFKNVIQYGAESALQPYVAGRWIGGTLTNFPEIKKRVKRLVDMKEKKEKGEFSKHTKKERLLMDREIKKLEESFGGIVSMPNLPTALFVIDSRKEKNAIAEAIIKKIPIIALSSSDCDFTNIDYPIPANDSSLASVSFFVNQIVEVCKIAQNAGKSKI